MTKKVITFVISIIFTIQLNAQSFKIVGEITNKEANNPISDATVTLTISKDSTLYTISDSVGKFSILTRKISRELILKITALNYKTLIINKTIEPNSTYINLGNIKLVSSSIELKEVKIGVKKRYSDTTEIDFSKQKFERSIMVNDLLSAKNGFRKDDKGQLYYKGIPVSDIKVNGQDFFDKKNTNIFAYLPALIIDNLQASETNIDDVTNSTLTNPTVKLNLRLKEQYKKGLFGNANMGIGTSNRYVTNGDLYYYNKRDQFSLAFNTNNININDDPLVEPKVTFTSNGNDILSHNAKLTYRTTLNKHLKIDFFTKIKSETRSYISELERMEETKNQFSKTSNSSNSRSLGIENSNLILKYDIDTLSSITYNQDYNYRNLKQLDSSSLQINNNYSNSNSKVIKYRDNSSQVIFGKLTYKRRISSKVGRLLTIETTFDKENDKRSEYNNVFLFQSTGINTYFINGNRNNLSNKYALNICYSEPFLEDGNIEFFTNYKKEILQYTPFIVTDTTAVFVDNPVETVNTYIKPGIKMHKVWKKISFDELASAILDYRNIDPGNTKLFFNPDLDLKIGYKINRKKDLLFGYAITANYPTAVQTTNINNTFDLISQMQGNPELKPETKRNANVSFMLRKSDSLSLSISASYEDFSSKFGINISNTSNSIQKIFQDNLGQASSWQTTFLLTSYLFKKQQLNYFSNLSYQLIPTITDMVPFSNKSFLINQSISTTTTLIFKKLDITPTLSGSFNTNKYQLVSSNILAISYSDKISLSLGKFQINAFPLVNFSHSIQNKFTWAMNGDAHLSIFKTYGTIWLRVYDIFNSFKYYNTSTNAVFTQIVKFSNLNRYALCGISLKFNNIR